MTVGAALLPMLGLGACGSDYLHHGDTVTASAGNAIAHNVVMHSTDPWSPASANTRIAGNGARVDSVTKRYLAGPGQQSPASSGTTFTISRGSGESSGSSGSQ
jgi:hypothetical protein